MTDEEDLRLAVLSHAANVFATMGGKPERVLDHAQAYLDWIKSEKPAKVLKLVEPAPK